MQEATTMAQSQRRPLDFRPLQQLLCQKKNLLTIFANWVFKQIVSTWNSVQCLAKIPVETAFMCSYSNRSGLRRQKTRRQVQVAAAAGARTRGQRGKARRGGARRPKQVVNPRFYLRLILMINTSCNQPAPAPRPRPARSLVEEVTQCGNILKCK